MAALMMMGCTGKKSTNLNDIPETRVYNHCDTLLIACVKPLPAATRRLRISGIT